MKNKKQTLLLLLAFMMVVVMGGSSCKDFGIPDYTLTITIDEDITGSPEAGVSTHAALTEIPYEYNHFENDHVPVVIKLNERLGRNNGAFVIYNNLEVHVQFFQIHQEWKFTLINAEGVENEITVTFEGDSYTDGTFTDSRTGDAGPGRGTWQIRNYLIQLVYENWEEYVLTSDPNNPIPSMSGTWTNGPDLRGTWTAQQVN